VRFTNGQTSDTLSYLLDRATERGRRGAAQVYSWDAVDDGSYNAGAPGIPCTLFVLGQPLGQGTDDEYSWRVLALQDHSLDPRRPARFVGEIALTGKYRHVTVALLQGVREADALDVVLQRPRYNLPGSARLNDPEHWLHGLHYAQWLYTEMLGQVANLQFARQPDGAWFYSFTFTGASPAPMKGEWPYVAALFDADGWIVGWAEVTLPEAPPVGQPIQGEIRPVETPHHMRVLIGRLNDGQS
jgi:hypothetical protein